MIAGPAPTAGKTFELTQFNSKHPTIDPVTGKPIAPEPFHVDDAGLLGSRPASRCRSLDLIRVFVLTGPDTCSASESIINSLRGIGVPVIQIGSTTCGKPYGFYPQDNCGTTYFSIEFRGRQRGGLRRLHRRLLTEQCARRPPTRMLPGCSVADDFTHALGDPAEARLAAALQYRTSALCPVPSGFALAQGARSIAAVDGQLPASPLRQLRILRH